MLRVLTIEDLPRNSAQIVSELQRLKRPILVTHRGRSAAILEDVGQYRRKLARLELLEAVLQGTRDVESGDVYDPDQVLEELEGIVGRHAKIPRAGLGPRQKGPERNRAIHRPR